MRTSWAITAARVALAVTFLSAVADRFGLWGPAGAEGVAWGDYSKFLEYARSMLPILPPALANAAASVATFLELLFAALLLVGAQLRWAALGSALLLGCFAICVTLSFGLKPALDYSVWSACAASLLLAASVRETAE